VSLVVGLDGDDTLWHNETFFLECERQFLALVGEPAADRLQEVQVRNLELFGYGAKAYTLSLLETALDVTGGELPGSHVQAILDMGKALLRHPVELLDGVAEAIAGLGEHRLVLITKGDLFHQEAKVAGSGLGDRFERVEIVAEKDEASYRRVLATLGVPPADFVMVGNSLRSDVVPPVRIGARAVHVPYEVEWVHEAVADEHLPPAGWWRIANLRELPALLSEIAHQPG
jgi:putative hydrolase of the HAD superfamily